MAQVLRPLEGLFPQAQHPDLLLGLSSGDDAAVYRLNDGTALIFTVDFFTPIVDSPYDYGRIAAANAMSDVYAMGGEVALALNICAFPSALPPEVHQQIITGGAHAVQEAGGVLAGGHSISDDEPKYGLAVIGFCPADRVLAKSTARTGDLLVLTKPLGTGVITTAAKQDRAEPEHIAGAVESMKRLNREASRILSQCGASACTDVTGFSLVGHAWEIAEHSRVRLVLQFPELPFLDGAEGYAVKHIFPGGALKNRSWYEPKVTWQGDLSDEMKTLLCAPETSGGLLASVSRDQEQKLKEQFAQAGIEVYSVGYVESSGESALVIS